jgi:endogenous inhibitor of DNA gyrase (YacG/DUF329 family)
MAARCPECEKPVPEGENPHRPFCSERCRVLDLGAWLDGTYKIPGPPVDPEPPEGSDPH